MDIFYDFNLNKSINISKIRGIDIAGKKSLRITFNDGDSEIVNTYGDAETATELFGKTILQLIPCTAPIYNVYDNHDGTFLRERVDYFALCVDGVIRSLDCVDGYFDFADGASNFKGFYIENMLDEYPESKSENP
jgi:hypothetical protein